MAEPQKSKVKVIVRIRPFLSHEPKQRCVYVDAKNSKILELVYSSKTEAVRYSFDRCFDVEAKQASIFDEEIEPVLNPLMHGINTSIFCYGMTGAGKTHTMQGTAAEPGIIPRSVDTVLKMIQNIEERDKKAKSQALPYTVSVSYYEIYNEKLYDLLEAKESDLPIREDMNKNIVIPGLADVPIKDFKHFETLYEQGCRNRSTGPTKLNNQSSRSHAILTIKVQRVDGNKKIAGKLHLIDLAGSEDNRRTDNTGVRMTESTNINTSLFVLGKVVTALNDQQKRIPYRDSKLTRLLQDSLGGNSYSVMIANVAPGLAHYNNTQNALNFAAKSRLIVNNPTVNVQEEIRPPPVEVKIKETKPVTAAAPVVNTQTINEAEKKFAEITKRLEKLEKEKQVKLVGHVLRDKGILDAADQERLELLEHEVVTQYKKKRKEEQIASVHKEGYAKMPLYTPATKKRKVLSKIVKAKEFDERGLDTAALEYYKIARSMLSPEEITDKLDRRIKELEGKTKPVATKNKENMPNFNDLLEQAADSKVGSKRKLSHSESDDENPKKKRRSSSKDFEVMKRNIRNQLPSLTDDKIQSVLSKVLSVLNEGDIKAIQELETIGKKRAQDIINYRVEQKIKNVEQLVECGFGEGMVVNFVKRNIFETLYLSAK